MYVSDNSVFVLMYTLYPIFHVPFVFLRLASSSIMLKY